MHGTGAVVRGDSSLVGGASRFSAEKTEPFSRCIIADGNRYGRVAKELLASGMPPSTLHPKGLAGACLIIGRKIAQQCINHGCLHTIDNT